MNRFAAVFWRIRAVAVKELRQLRRDKLTGGMILGVPLMQILIFGYGINFDVRHLHAGYVDEANTVASRALIADLRASQVLDFTESARTIGELRQHMAAGEISAGLYIPADFERRRLERSRPAAQLLVDGASPGIEGPLRNLASVPLHLRQGAVADSWRALEVQTEYNPEHRTAVQVVPALIGVILNMTMVIFTAIALVRERERGNLELLITTPVKSVELMVGKLLPYVLVGLIQTTIILVTGVLLFDVPFNGGVMELYLGASLFIAATLALGLLISTVTTTQFQAMQMGFMTMLPSILLSGFMFPFQGMPRAAQWLAQILPLTHFTDIVRGVVLRGASLGSLSLPIIKLAAFLVVAVAVAALRFRKRLG